jgi:hypothetical protein
MRGGGTESYSGRRREGGKDRELRVGGGGRYEVEGGTELRMGGRSLGEGGQREGKGTGGRGRGELGKGLWIGRGGGGGEKD